MLPAPREKGTVMVKGCQKRTIHIKDTDSKYYEEAYFVLKPGVSESKISSGDMISEAVRIAGESIGGSESPQNCRQSGGLLSFMIGLVSGGAAAAAVLLIILL